MIQNIDRIKKAHRNADEHKSYFNKPIFKIHLSVDSLKTIKKATLYYF